MHIRLSVGAGQKFFPMIKKREVCTNSFYAPRIYLCKKCLNVPTNVVAFFAQINQWTYCLPAWHSASQVGLGRSVAPLLLTAPPGDGLNVEDKFHTLRCMTINGTLTFNLFNQELLIWNLI